MITKNEAAECLTRRGFPSINEGGVVRIRPENPLTKEEIGEVKQILNEIGYVASYGYAMRQEPEENRKKEGKKWLRL